jgi:hypothetical protein
MSHHSISKAERSRRGCDEGNGGITLPDELCASVYAGNLGQTRHLAVAPAGGSTGG